MQVALLPYRLHVVSIPLQAVPQVAFALVRLLSTVRDGNRSGERFLSCTKTQSELSLVLDEQLYSTLCRIAHVDLAMSELPFESWPQQWVAMRVDQGSYVTEEAHAVLQALSEPLAEAMISIFYLSTFESDYCLVEATQLHDALAVLQSRHSVMCEGMEYFEGQEKGSREGGDCGCVPPGAPQDIELQLAEKEELLLAKVPLEQVSLFGASLLEFLLCSTTSLVSYTEVEADVSFVLSLSLLQRLPSQLQSTLNMYAEPWCALSVQGPLGYAECGIVSTISKPLLEGRLQIFYLSTYQTDICFVHTGNTTAAADALEAAGIRVQIKG